MTTSVPAPTLLADLQACCSPATGGVLTSQAAQRLAGVFKALGDPTRVMLVSIIAARPDGEACVCDLTGPVGLAQPTVSHHLRILVDAGILSREQRTKWAYYRVVPGALGVIATVVADVDLRVRVTAD